MHMGVINSVVECLPYKQKVTGSNPVLPNLRVVKNLITIDNNSYS